MPMADLAQSVARLHLERARARNPFRRLERSRKRAAIDGPNPLALEALAESFGLHPALIGQVHALGAGEPVLRRELRGAVTNQVQAGRHGQNLASDEERT